MYCCGLFVNKGGFGRADSDKWKSVTEAGSMFGPSTWDDRWNSWNRIRGGVPDLSEAA